MFLTVPAQELRPQDYCRGSRTLILAAPSRGLDTPPGKVEIPVRRHNGKHETVVWNARTRIGIERKW